jgi:hypothetical protein
MQFNNFLEGMNILKKYIEDETDPYALSAKRDEFYVYADRKISKEDQKQLDALGWYNNKENQEDSWLAMT